MTTSSTFDDQAARLDSGDTLTPAEISALAAAPDILPLGMLADAMRRRLHGTRVTFLRVAEYALDAIPDAVPPAAREIRISGAPDTLAAAVAAVRAARAVAGDRFVSGFSWLDVERLVERSHERVGSLLEALRDAGLDGIAELPLDSMGEPAVALDRLTRAGFQQLRLTIDKPVAENRVDLLLRAAALQDQFACLQALNPLPTTLTAFRPTTGYEDVKMVALARLAAPNIPSIQVDWLRYGPKLAQVALTFGADDVYGVSASDDAGEGRRRAPLEDIRRNIEAAGFEAAQRNGRYVVEA